jgi:hypothetical protein
MDYKKDILKIIDTLIDHEQKLINLHALIKQQKKRIDELERRENEERHNRHSTIP